MNTEQQKQLLKKFKEENQQQGKKKFIAQAVTATMVASVIAPTVADVVNVDDSLIAEASLGEYSRVFAGGDGSEFNPYLINSVLQLNQLRNINNTTDTHFKIISDIQMPKGNWTPIPSFNGILNGEGHTLKGMNIKAGSTSNVGLFASLARNGIVKNLNIVETNIVGGNHVGILAGNSIGNVENVYVQGNIEAGSNVGGLIGSSTGGDLLKVSTNVNIVAENSVGGILGSSSGIGGGVHGRDRYSTIVESYAVGSIKGNDSIGGIVGEGKYFADALKGNSFNAKNIYSQMDIIGVNNVGGLFGRMQSGYSRAGQYPGTSSVSINFGYASGKIVGKGQSVGGLFGHVHRGTDTYSTPKLSNLYNFNESILGFKDVSQFIGYANYSGENMNIVSWEGTGGAGGKISNTITREEALELETYLFNSWDFEGSINTPVWAIDDGKSLPYFISLGPTKDYDWNPTEGNWDSELNEESVQKALVLNATLAVEKAEKTKLVTDIENAEDLVAMLTPSLTKTNLEKRLKDLRDLLEVEKHQWSNTQNAVDKAKFDPSDKNITDAQDLITKLPTDPRKDDLQAQLDKIIKDKADKEKAEQEKQQAIEDAQNAIDKAKTDPSDQNIKDAQDAINKVPNGSEKDDLQAQLEQIIKDKAEQEDNEAQAEKDRLLAATKAVEQAEETFKQSDFDHAQGLVNALKESVEKKALQDRLDAIQEDVTVEGKPTDPVEPEVPTESDQDKALRLATEAVEQVEQTLILKDYYTALDLVVQLDTSEDKNKLVERLENVLKQIIQAIEDKVNDMKDKDLDDLEKDELLNAIDDLNKLPNGNEVEDLKNDLEDLLEQLNKHEEEKKFLSEAERLVGLAERYERDPYISNAQQAVNKLKEGEKKEALQARLDALQTKIENAEVDKLVRAAQQAVETATRLLREPYFGRAQDAINKVPADHEQRPILQAQLDILVDNIKQAEQDKQFLDAERFVSLAEGRYSEANIARAQRAIEILPIDSRKDVLQERLDTLIDYQLYGVALEAVERAEGSPTSSIIQVAQRLVNKIPSTDDRKQPLQDRLDVLALEAEQSEQQKEAQTQLEKATTAVENAEKIKRQALIDYAQNEVNKISNTFFKTQKDALQDRLDELLNVDIAAQIAKAEKAVESAIKFKRPAYIKQAEKAIMEVQDETEQTRLMAILKEILGEDAEEDYVRAAETAVKLAEIRASAATITKAQELVDKLNDSNPMKEVLQVRLDKVDDGNNVSFADTQQAETALKIAEIRKTDATMNQAKELIDMLEDGKDKDALLERYETLVKVTEQEKDPVIRLATTKLTQAERLKRNPYFAQAREAIQAMEEGDLKTSYLNRLDEARLSIFEDLHIVNLERKAEKRVLYAEYQLEEGYFLVAKHLIDELKEVNTSKANELLDRLNAAIALSKDNPEPKPVLDFIQKQLDKEITNQNSQVYKDFDKVFITIKDAMNEGDYHSLLGAMYAVDGLLDSYGKLYYDLIDSYIIYVDAALKMYQVTNP